MSAAGNDYLVQLFGKYLGNDIDNGLVLQKNIVINENSAVIDAVKQVSPAVVSIIVSKDLSDYYSYTGPNFLPFDDYFEYEVYTYWDKYNEIIFGATLTLIIGAIGWTLRMFFERAKRKTISDTEDLAV